MKSFAKFHKNESGQTALETAIILIAFVVVASVFAFTILSAGSASTERGEEAIYSGLDGVQSSLTTRGAILAESASGAVTNVRFTVALAAGGDPVNLTAGGPVVVNYRDATEIINDLAWTRVFLTEVGTANNLLEEGELAEITVPVAAATLAGNTEFTLEVKPPTGAVLNISRTTPAALSTIMELR